MESLSGKIPLSTLRRCTYNSLLYSHKDTMAKGDTLWTFWDDELHVTAFDDYFSLVDICDDLVDQPSLGDPQYFLMTLGDLKELDKVLRDSEGEVVSLDGLVLAGASDQDPSFQVLYEAAGLSFQSSGTLTKGRVDSFALSPDRLRKLSWIKPGGFPIDCQVFDMEGHKPFIGFRCGPTVRGAMSLMDRDKLAELYEGEEIFR